MGTGRRKLRAWRSALEWLPIAGALRVVPALSRATVLRWARALGWLACQMDRRGRRVAAANLGVICGARLTPRRRRILLVGSYRHAARVLLDLFWFARDGRRRLREWAPLADDVRAVLTAATAVCVTGHQGNWEVMGQTVASHDLAIASVAKRLGSPATTARLNALRSALGQQIVMAEGALRTLVRLLRKGYLVGILQDQHTDPAEGGIWVDFLGLPAAVSGAAATLAIRLNLPVHVVVSRACRDGHYRMAVVRSLPAGSIADVTALTQAITDGLTQEIRRHPAQWLVMYKRWKRIPPGADAAAFPFYARPWHPAS